MEKTWNRVEAKLMKAVEFMTLIKPDGTFTLPPEVAAQVPPEQQVRVLILFPDSSDDADWARLTTEEFARGYAESDAIYDELSTR
jgi:hypothetical protein